MGVKYTVDLDNKEMVERAKECIHEDLYQALVKSGDPEEFQAMLLVRHDPKLGEKDINDFLLDLEESCEDEDAE